MTSGGVIKSSRPNVETGATNSLPNKSYRPITIQFAEVNIQNTELFNPRRAGGLDFPWSAGRRGGGVFTPPSPSNSTPELRRDMRQAAFESSSKITQKVFGHC